MITIPLKLKHRNPNRALLKRSKVDPPEGTWVWFANNGGRTRYGGNGERKRASIFAGLGPRRRTYNCHMH